MRVIDTKVVLFMQHLKFKSWMQNISTTTRFQCYNKREPGLNLGYEIGHRCPQS